MHARRTEEETFRAAPSGRRSLQPSAAASGGSSQVTTP